MGETYRVGLLGHGTVGAAFERLIGERADAIEHITGRKPEVTGVLTRSRGDFEQILADSDLVVELIGGIEPARDYVLRAMQAGKHVVSANKLLLASYGEELWGDRARAQRPAALRGRGRRRRAGHPRAAGVARRRARRAHPRDRQRHDELHPHRDGARRDLLRRRAAARAGAGLRRGRPDRRRDRPRRRGQDGDPRPARVLDPGPSRPGHLRGHRAPDARGRRLRARPQPRPEADRHRRARRRRHLRARAPGLPVSGPPAGVASTAPSTRSRSSPTRSPRSRCRARAPAATRPRAPCSATSSAR